MDVSKETSATRVKLDYRLPCSPSRPRVFVLIRFRNLELKCPMYNTLRPRRAQLAICFVVDRNHLAPRNHIAHANERNEELYRALIRPSAKAEHAHRTMLDDVGRLYKSGHANRSLLQTEGAFCVRRELALSAHARLPLPQRAEALRRHPDAPRRYHAWAADRGFLYQHLPVPTVCIRRSGGPFAASSELAPLPPAPGSSRNQTKITSLPRAIFQQNRSEVPAGAPGPNRE